MRRHLLPYPEGFEPTVTTCRECAGSTRLLVAGPVYAEFMGLPLDAMEGPIDMGPCMYCLGTGAVPGGRNQLQGRGPALRAYLDQPDPVGTLYGSDRGVSVALRLVEVQGRACWLVLSPAQARQLAAELVDGAMIAEQRDGGDLA